MKADAYKSKLRIPAKASFYYMISTIVGKGIGFILTPIFTRVIAPDEYGYFSYYISLLSIVSLVSSLFLSPAVIYSGLSKFGERNAGFENTTILSSSILNIGFCTLLFAFNSAFALDRRIIIFILIQNLFDIITTTELLSGKFSYDYLKVVTISLVSSFLAPVISLFLIFLFDIGALGRIIGLLLSGGSLASVLLIKRLVKTDLPTKEHLMFLLKNSLPLFPATLARAVTGWSDKLIIKGALGVEELAKYSVAHTVGLALFGLIGASFSALNPWIIRRLGRGDDEEIFDIIKNLSDLISFGSIIIIGLAPEILFILAPGGYSEAVYTIIPFALSTVPYFLFNLYSVFITYKEKTKFISVYALIGAVINLGLNLILIKSIGYIGGAISYFIAEIVVYLLIHLFAKKNIFNDVGRQRDGANFSISFSILMAAPLVLLYPYLPIRLVILILPACLAVNRGFSCLKIAREK